MRRADKFVAIAHDGGVTIHAKGNLAGNYATLCGVDGNDLGVGQAPAELPPKAKIDCDQCKFLFKAFRAYRVTDFTD